MEDIKMRDSNDLREIMFVSGVKASTGTPLKACAGTAEKACAGTPDKFPGSMALRMPALPGDDVSSQEVGTEASRLDKTEESETNDN
jgi:hypothetical protein